MSEYKKHNSVGVGRRERSKKGGESTVLFWYNDDAGT